MRDEDQIEQNTQSSGGDLIPQHGQVHQVNDKGPETTLIEIDLAVRSAANDGTLKRMGVVFCVSILGSATSSATASHPTHIFTAPGCWDSSERHDVPHTGQFSYGFVSNCRKCSLIGPEVISHPNHHQR